jgi:DNA-binding transcriptional ArsR family regulator
VSQHLAVLKAAGLVADRAAGRRRLYAVDPAGLEALRAYLEGMWGQALADYRRAAEGGTRPTGAKGER